MGIGQWLLIAGYFLAFVCILIGYTWTIVLYCLGGSYLREMRAAPAGDEADYLWVFLVPALNEGVTIADSVARLRAVQATHKVILVINDGSEDDTAEVLDRIAGPDLEVFTRTAPNARQGKAVALNAAFRHVQDEVLSRPGMGRWDPAKVIVGIVDADGRLADSAPALVARHFDKPRVGGVQVGVAIYNVESYLTRMQSLEFQIFGGLFQVGRSRWGAAFMGGNGQFNRMSALIGVASDEGPWSHYLTEDQEDLMRDAWGRMVEVTGMITRDEITDRPRAIRRVADVQVLEEGADAFAFRRARGAVSPAPGSPASEVLIRRVRDAV